MRGRAGVLCLLSAWGGALSTQLCLQDSLNRISGQHMNLRLQKQACDRLRACMCVFLSLHLPQVVISSYWQRLLRLPPAAAASMTLLQHDFHNSFSSTLFFGQELRLYVFEALLFSSLHMSLGNAAAAGFITLIVQQVLVWVRQHFGQNNLARKTLVDSHFLI